MKDFFSKEYTEQDINDLISNKAKESINLEFKSSGSLEMTDKNKLELSKDVSPFANSEGGIIVYGIKEEKHVAESLSFIDGSIFTKEWIEQVIQWNIHRKIDGVLIIPVRFGNDISKTVYVIKIPTSEVGNREIESFFNRNIGSHRLYSIPNKSPLLQDDVASVCPFLIRVTKRTFDNPENFIIKTKLYFSNGIKSKEFDLREILQINGRKLEREMFRDEK